MSAADSMMSSRRLLGAGVLGALLVLALTPLSPLYTYNPSRDSGVFLYAGQQIVDGRVAYREVWDHKPPLIFFLNALGLLIAGGSWWGVWVLEVISAAAATLLGWLALRRFGDGVALFATAAWFCGWSYLAREEGNYTEEFALAVQFFGLFLFSRADSDRPRSWFLQGTATGLGFLLRPNLVGIWLAMGFVMSLGSPIRNVVRNAFSAAVGFVLVLALALWPFVGNGAMPPLIDQVFTYNFAYTAQATIQTKLAATMYGLTLLSWSGATLLAIPYWLLSVVRATRSWSQIDPLVRLAIVAFPLEILLASLPGRLYSHYFMALLPTLSILNAAAAREIVSATQGPAQRIGRRLLPLAGILLLNVPLLQIARTIAKGPAWHRTAHSWTRDETARLASETLHPNETLLMWGAESAVNFLSERRSPTAYVHQYPLYTSGYTKPEMVLGFLRQLQAQPPTLIVDTSSSNKIIPPIDERRNRWRPQSGYAPGAEIDLVTEWVRDNYLRIVRLEPYGWVVWRRRGIDGILEGGTVEERWWPGGHRPTGSRHRAQQ